MDEKFLSVAVIGALGTAIVAVVKAFFGTKNENASSQQEFIIRLVEMSSRQSENIEDVRKSINRVHTRIDDVEKRLDGIEKEVKKE